MDHGHLPRLPREAYQGFAFVHWTMTTKDRATGWLNEAFYARFRETLLHALSRYQCVCPVFTVMPDHLHALVIGWNEKADQILMTRFLRTHGNELLESRGPDCRFQKQPYDNVLREEDRQRDAFESTACYITRNPVRAGLVQHPRDYQYTGCMVPGYPRLDLWAEDYWDHFWKIFHSKLP